MREAIILAGGKGTRLREVVSDVPKPMAPINGTPFLEILLKKLVRSKFDRIIVSVGYMGEVIMNYFGDKFDGLPIFYVDEPVPLGTGGGIKKSLYALNSECGLILNGDTYADVDYEEMYKLYDAKKNIVVGLTKVSNVARYGSVMVLNGVLNGFHEKGVSGPGLINIGSYIVGKNALESFEDGINFSFEVDFLQKVYKTTTISVCEFSGKFIDIGIPEDYIYAQSYLKNA